MPSRAHTALGPERAVIFVVDDDDVVRESVKVLLEARHYVVEDFASGRALLEREPGATADCLLLDVNMPTMNGIEVVQALRQQGDRTPVILMTGMPSQSKCAQARAMGVRLLEKPIPPVALVSAIEQTLGGQGGPSR